MNHGFNNFEDYNQNFSTMKRPILNFLIDALSFTAFIFLVTTGVLMRYILPPGTGRLVTIWGLDRHEWGGIHFWISVAFFTLMALHLLQHWKWIINMVKGKRKEGSGIRAGMGIIGLIMVLVIALSPVFSQVKQLPERENSTTLYSHIYDDIIIRGSMTLNELEEKSGVPAADILEALNLPAYIPGRQQLGYLSRTYDIRMADIRKAVHEIREKQN